MRSLKSSFSGLCALLLLGQVSLAQAELPEFTELVQDASPAVVNISTRQKLPQRCRLQHAAGQIARDDKERRQVHRIDERFQGGVHAPEVPVDHEGHAQRLHAVDPVHHRRHGQAPSRNRLRSLATSFRGT